MGVAEETALREAALVARPERFELPTFWFVARRSIQLSYGRETTILAKDALRSNAPASPEEGSVREKKGVRV